MLDLKFIRENRDLVRNGAEAKGIAIDLDIILNADDRRKALIQEGDVLKSKRNQVSAQVGKMKKEGSDASSVIAEMESVKTRIQEIDSEMREVEKNLNALLAYRAEHSPSFRSDRKNTGRQQRDLLLGRIAKTGFPYETALGVHR